MYLFSAVEAKPYADLHRFAELGALRDQWQLIREEALQLFDAGYICAAASYNDLDFNSLFRRGWKRFYLRWYDDFLPSAKVLCPRTTELLAAMPSVNAAMFALLPPGSLLGKTAIRLPVHCAIIWGCSRQIRSAAASSLMDRPTIGETAKRSCSMRRSCTGPRIRPTKRA